MSVYVYVRVYVCVMGQNNDNLGAGVIKSVPKNPDSVGRKE